MKGDPVEKERFDGLVDLAYNLWWSWHQAARVLFKQVNGCAWKESRHNPVRMLLDVPEGYLRRAARDQEYLRRYDIIMERYRDYMGKKSSWFTKESTACRPVTVAYFSAEYGLHHSLPFYAGGLGFLAGDHLRGCSDLSVPLVAVGFMTPQAISTSTSAPADSRWILKSPSTGTPSRSTRRSGSEGEDHGRRII